MHSQEQTLSTPSGRYHCSKCGSPLSKSRPSSKSRRAHKKICGTIEGHKRACSENSTVSADEHYGDLRNSGLNSGCDSSGIGVSSRSEDETYCDAVMEFPDSGFNSKTERSFDNTEKSFCEVEKSRDIATDLDVIQQSNDSTENYLVPNQSPENASTFRLPQDDASGLELYSQAMLSTYTKPEGPVVPSSDLSLMESLTPGHDPVRLEDPSNSSGRMEDVVICDNMAQCRIAYIGLKSSAERTEEEKTLPNTALSPCNAANKDEESSLFDYNFVEIGKEIQGSVEGISGVESSVDLDLKRPLAADYKVTPTVKMDVEDNDFSSDLQSKHDSPIILKDFDDYKLDPNLHSGGVVQVAEDFPAPVSRVNPLASPISAEFKESEEEHIQICKEVKNDEIVVTKSENPTGNSGGTSNSGQIMGTGEFHGVEIGECDADAISKIDSRSASFSSEVMLLNDKFDAPNVDRVLGSDDIGNLRNLKDEEIHETHLECGKSNQSEKVDLSQRKAEEGSTGDDTRLSSVVATKATESGVLPPTCSSDSGSTVSSSHFNCHAFEARSFMKQRTPLKALLGEGEVNAAENMVPVGLEEYDRGLKPDVARIGTMKEEWECGGRYPAAIKREHKKIRGRRCFAQLVCCASSPN